MDSAQSNSVFKLQSYWEERFKKEERYEWLASWQAVAKQLLPYLQPHHNILVVGCGNSSFSADLYEAGFHNITNIDFASSVIERMTIVHAEACPLMQWLAMDMTQLSFPPHSFDVVLDKAAMDALVVDEGDVWDPIPEVVEVVDSMCNSIQSVLKPYGIYLQISFAQPHFRSKYLMGYRAEGIATNPYESYRGFSARYEWTLQHEAIDTAAGCLNSFLYIMKRSSVI
jgi:SAM-dependent methyltransferase